MKSDTPDDLFVFSDSPSLGPNCVLLSSEADSVFSDHSVDCNEKVSKLTQEDIDDMSVDPSFPLRNPRFKPVIDISVDDLPF